MGLVIDSTNQTDQVEHDKYSISGGKSKIMKRVSWFFLTVYLAMSVSVDLIPSMGSFCDLAWGSLLQSSRRQT